VSLVSFDDEKSEETNKQKIERLREENLYYARFRIDDYVLLNFEQDDDQMLLQYRTSEDIRDLGSFKLVAKDDIIIDTIPGTENIFLSLASDYYILDTQSFTLKKLPFNLSIEYIKS
jgi:hypothetical protein